MTYPRQSVVTPLLSSHLLTSPRPRPHPRPRTPLCLLLSIMDSVLGDRFIEDCARYIRFNEAKLGQAGSSSSTAANWINPAAWLRTNSPPINNRNGNNNAPRPPQIRPSPLRLTSHHLYYLLIRFEALTIPTGPLDVQIPSTSRPTSSFAFISSNVAGSGYRKDRDDSMSISSLQTTMSAFGLGTNQGTGWWGGKKADISQELKYIYSAMTKIPSIRIGPPPIKLIQGFEDCPGELSIPLDTFKNVQLLEFEDTDPRAFLGWDRLSTQLRSLSIKRSGVEDITDIIVDAVIMDGKRRRGEKVRHRVRKIHAPTSEDQPEVGATGSTLSNTSSNSQQLPHLLPSLSWHFLRHLSLSDNSLTFLHSSCLSSLTSLTSLDLSNNLLNAVPPSLNLLPNLQSLNLTNNLIDSVMGIPDALPSIKALNLSQNRLESLCGLERLPTLLRIDLRKNDIFEAGEVGRLATLPKIAEVFILGNPLFEEVDDARVEVFVEFAKEGNNLDALRLDNEGIGYFERQRVKERIPNLDRLGRGGRDDTPSADEVLTSKGISKPRGEGPAPLLTPANTSTAATDGIQSSEPLVKTVRHRNNHSTTLPKSNAQRRNRRIVELPQDAAIGEQQDSASASASNHAREHTEESDSDIIKRAALAGDNDAALGTIPRQYRPHQSPRIVAAELTRTTSPLHTLTKKSGAVIASISKDWDESSAVSSTNIAKEGKNRMRIRSHEDAASSSNSKSGNGVVGVGAAAKNNGEGEGEEERGIVPGPRMRVGRKSVAPTRRSKVTMSMYDSSSSKSAIPSQQQATSSENDNDLRKKIEALKGEVGDDWLRLLARGESVYVPNEEDEGGEGG